MPVRHVNNGDGSVTQFDADTGRELVTFLDPDGSFTRDHIEPAAASAPTAAPTGLNADRLSAAARTAAPKETVIPETTTVTPQPRLTPTEQAFESHLSTKSPVEQAAEPQASVAVAKVAPLAAPRTPAAPVLPAAATHTEGLDAASRAAAVDSRQRVMGAQEQADQATSASEQEQLAARQQAITAEADRRMGQAAADSEMQEMAKQKLAEAEEYGRQMRAAPIRPADALGGDKFFFAVLANVGAGLSNFGSALLGQGAQMDPNVVDDIIRDGVRLQQEQKATNIEGADRASDAARADFLKGEIRANASLEKWFESQAAVEKLPEIKAAYTANAAQRAAARETKQRELAQEEWTRESVDRVVQKAGPAEPEVNEETAEEQKIKAANGTDDARLRKYGEQRLKTGADSFLTAADGAEQVITSVAKGQDVPGTGPLDKLLQPVTREADAAAVQQAGTMLTAQFGKLMSGASMSDAERKTLNTVVEGRGTLDDWKRGIQIMRRHAQSQLQTLDDSSPGEARAYAAISAKRKERRGLSDEQRIRRDEQLKGAKEEKGRVVSKDEAGKEYFESPEAKAKREARERRENAAPTERQKLGKLLGLDKL